MDLIRLTHATYAGELQLPSSLTEAFAFSNEFVETYRDLKYYQRGRAGVICLFFFGMLIVFGSAMVVQSHMSDCSRLKYDEQRCYEYCIQDSDLVAEYPNATDDTSSDNKWCDAVVDDPTKFWYPNLVDSSGITFCMQSRFCISVGNVNETLVGLICNHPKRSMCSGPTTKGIFLETAWTLLIGESFKFLFSRLLLRRILLVECPTSTQCFPMRSVIVVVANLLLATAIGLAFQSVSYSMYPTFWTFVCAQMIDWAVIGSVRGATWYWTWHRQCGTRNLPRPRYDRLDAITASPGDDHVQTHAGEDEPVTDPVEQRNLSKHTLATTTTLT